MQHHHQQLNQQQKQRPKKEKGDKRDADLSPEPRPKARVRPNPTNEQPEAIHPKRKGRPPNKPDKPDSSEDDVEIQGVVLNNNKTQKYWKEQSAKEIRNQLHLRKIPPTSAWITNKGLLDIVKQLVKENKW